MRTKRKLIFVPAAAEGPSNFPSGAIGIFLLGGGSGDTIPNLVSGISDLTLVGSEDPPDDASNPPGNHDAIRFDGKLTLNSGIGPTYTHTFPLDYTKGTYAVSEPFPNTFGSGGTWGVRFRSAPWVFYGEGEYLPMASAGQMGICTFRPYDMATESELYPNIEDGARYLRFIRYDPTPGQLFMVAGEGNPELGPNSDRIDAVDAYPDYGMSDMDVDHIAIVSFTPEYVKLYVDNVLVGTTTRQTENYETDYLTIQLGLHNLIHSSERCYFDGELNWLAVYDRTLTGDATNEGENPTGEINALYEAMAAEPGTYPTYESIVLPHDTIPNLAVSADTKAISSGPWSSSATWDNGLPAAGDTWGICAGIVVDYDMGNDTTRYRAGGIAPTGRLRFPRDADSQLWIQHLMEYWDEDSGKLGWLDMGTETNPIQAAFTCETIILNEPLETGTAASPGVDPKQYGNGLISLGKWTAKGKERTRLLRLGAEPQATDTTLTLSATPTGWEDGDDLLIPDSRQLDSSTYLGNYASHWEIRQQASRSGTVVTLDSALSYDHPGGESNYSVGQGTGEADFLPHVANLTSNVIVRSEDGTGTRGHIFVTHRAHLDICDIRISQMGRTANGPASSGTQGLNNTILGKTVTGATNASPIVVTVSDDFTELRNLLHNGDEVYISGVGGNTAANGTFTIANVTLGLFVYTFELVGTTGNGAYTSGGTVNHIGTNQIGRYAFHAHHLYGPVNGVGDFSTETADLVLEATTATGDSILAATGSAGPDPIDLTGVQRQGRIERVVIDDPLPAPPSATLPASKWGMTVHGTGYLEIKDCVVLHYAGSGGAIEDGSEKHNAFIRVANFSCIGDVSARETDGRSGTGIFGIGFNNFFIDCVSAGCAGKYSGIVSGSGYLLFVPPSSTANTRQPLYPGADVHDGTEGVDYELVNILEQPIAAFYRNEAYGAIAAAIDIWHLGSGGYSTVDVTPTVLLECVSWHAWEEGLAFLYPTSNLIIDGCVYRGDTTAGEPTYRGLMWGDYWNGGDSHIRNCDFRGCMDGISGNTNIHGTLRIENVNLLVKQHGIAIDTPSTPGTGSGSGDQEIRIVNCPEVTFYGSVSPRYEIAMVYSIAAGNTNLRVLQAVYIEDYHQVTDDNFRLYYEEQLSTYVMPQSVGSPTFLTACPEADLTNAEAYVAYHQDGTAKSPPGSLGDSEGCAIAGAVAPDDYTTRAEILGLIDES